MVAQSIIIDSILLIASIIVAATIASSYTSNFLVLSETSKQQSALINEKIRTEVEFIATYYESSPTPRLIAYVKNTGLVDVKHGSLLLTEFYLLSQNVHQVFTYSSAGGTGTWSYEILNDANNDGVWSPGETIRVFINLPAELQNGTYSLKMVLRNGVTAEHIFSL